MDLSNKTLALVLVVATSISLVGTILTIDRLSNVNVAYPVAGRATTDTGDANFSINSSISIVFISNLVDFGTGVVNGSGAHNCTLNTSVASFNQNDCIGFRQSQPLRLQNQGTQNVTLNITFNATGTEFIGGTSPELSFLASENESTACSGLTTALTPVATANQNYTLCGATRFDWAAGRRTVNLDLGLRIPQNAPPGDRRVRITAYASNP